MLISKILKNQAIWNLSQIVLGANEEKMKLYSSVIDNRGKILDFGCANGNTFEAFKDYDYTGVDIDSNSIDFANNKYKNYANARFICADVTKNSLEKESFDNILFAGTGHHIDNKLLFKITKSLSRLLKNGGSLYFIDTIRDKKRKSKLLSLLISLDQGKFHRTEYIYNHVLDKFSPDLKPIYHRTYKMKGTFVPQPTYYIAKLIKK